MEFDLMFSESSWMLPGMTMCCDNRQKLHFPFRIFVFSAENGNENPLRFKYNDYFDT